MSIFTKIKWSMIGSLLYLSMLKFWSDSVFWTMVTAIATIGLIIVAYGQLGGIKQSEKSQFYHKVTGDFFTKESMELIMLIEYNLIHFKENIYKEEGEEDNIDNNYPYYQINTDRFKKIHPESKIIDGKKILTLYDVERLVLNNFEDIHLFYKNGVLDLKNIYTGFSVYVTIVMESIEIKKHIEYVRKYYNDPTIYETCFDLLILMKNKPKLTWWQKLTKILN